MVICGDFNDIPTSLAVQYMAGVLDVKDFEKWKKSAVPQDVKASEEKADDGDWVASLSSPQDTINVVSVYDRHHPSPFFTTFKKRDVVVQRTIDYMWHTDVLQVAQILQLPSEKDLPNRLPAPNYPSDHLSLCSSFVWPDVAAATAARSK